MNPDPLYPFDTEQLVPLPPFLDPGAGLNFNGLTLAVKYSNPLTTNIDGSLNLKYGSGLALDKNGALVGGSFAKVAPPILLSSESAISLNYGSGLTVNSGRLEIENNFLSTTPPLSFDGNTVSINLGPEFAIVNGKLSLNVNEPLQVSGNNLILNVGSGLTVVDGQLSTS